MVFTTTATRDKWRDLYDEFGDSFTEDSTVADLKQSLSQAAGKKLLDPGLRLELEKELAGYPYHLLRGKVFYFDSDMNNDSRQLAHLRCEMYGGAVVDRLSASVTHVVLDPGDSGKDKEAAYRRERRSQQAAGRPLFRVVRTNWLHESIASGKLLDETDYEL